MIFIVVNINLLIIIAIIALLFVYLYNYFLSVITILSSINNSLNEKFEEVSQREILTNKLENLRKLLHYYEFNIEKTLTKINDIYNDYGSLLNKKKKEEAKLFKKEIKYHKDPKKKVDKIKTVIKNFKQINKIITLGSSYIKIIIFIFIICFIIYLILFIIWINYFSLESKVFSLISLYGQLATTTFKFVNGYLLMVYNNRTVSELSSFVEPTNRNRDFIAYVFTKLEGLYEMDKYFNQTKGIFDSFNDYIKSDCKSFFENLNIDIFNQLKNTYGEESDKLILSLTVLCESSSVFQVSNFKEIYIKIFNDIKIGMYKIQEFNYIGIIKSLDDLTIGRFEVVYLTVYNYLLEYLGGKIQISSVKNIMNRLSNFITLTGIMYLAKEVFLILSIFLLFTKKIDQDLGKLFRLKKIFRICNTYQ